MAYGVDLTRNSVVAIPAGVRPPVNQASDVHRSRSFHTFSS
ncbi:hypothetical protein SAMN06272765_7323 [Streptomyces sp. Ag109_G2-15]|nr:hypothetical protein SAMN06272765_7323 [Streptomyces sp. Ag109_G2-15]